VDTPGRSTARSLLVGGFVLGFLLPVPAAIAALLFPWAERIAPWLTPGLVLLRPLSDSMASWPGGVNMLLASLVNGLAFAAAGGCLGRLLQGRRHPA
jgi:hypothetical protein